MFSTVAYSYLRIPYFHIPSSGTFLYLHFQLPHLACKNMSGGVLAWLFVSTLERGTDLHMAQLIPLPLTASCFSKIQTGFTFLVPAHPGSPGQRAVKRMCVCYNGLEDVLKITTSLRDPDPPSWFCGLSLQNCPRMTFFTGLPVVTNIHTHTMPSVAITAIYAIPATV